MTPMDSVYEVKTNISTKKGRKEGRKAYVKSFVSRRELVKH